MSRLALTAPTILATLGVMSCAESAVEDQSGPRVYELSTYELAVGETFAAFGRDLLDAEEGTSRVRLQGVFEADTGELEDVDLTFTPLFEGRITPDDPDDEEEHVLRFPRFGPFDNPFSGASRPGVFHGKVIAINEHATGEIEVDENPPDLALKILPSLLIEELQPIESECGAPVIRGLPNLPYRMTVRPVGIQAVRFVYNFSDINGRSGVTTIEHRYDAPVSSDTAGEIEEVVFNRVPDDKQFHVMLIHAMAYQADGQSVEAALPLTIHRPIEVRFEGKLEVAERYEPEAVSGCIPGTIRGVVEYKESESETRQQTVSVTVSHNWVQNRGNVSTQSWTDGFTTGESRSQSMGSSEGQTENTSEEYGLTYGQSQANNVGFSSANGESWGWDMSEGQSEEERSQRMREMFGEGSYATTVGTSGEGSVPGFAKVTGSVSATVGVTAGGKVGGSEGLTRSTSSSRGWSGGGTSSEARSFGSTTTDSQSQSLSGSYALSSTRTRNINDTQARNQGRTWSFGGAGSQSETVSEGKTEAETQTWVTSETSNTTRSFQGFIPNGQFGIFYRQTTRLVKRAEVRTYDKCGVANHQGEIQLNEWTWAPDLAIGGSCATQPPPPQLPPASCLISPCGG